MTKTRGRPPSAKTLVDRQLGRNVKHPILPAEDSYIIPNHSGIHEDFFARRITLNNKSANETPINFDIDYLDPTSTPNAIKLDLDINSSENIIGGWAVGGFKFNITDDDKLSSGATFLTAFDFNLKAPDISGITTPAKTYKGVNVTMTPPILPSSGGGNYKFSANIVNTGGIAQIGWGGTSEIIGNECITNIILNTTGTINYSAIKHNAVTNIGSGNRFFINDASGLDSQYKGNQKIIADNKETIWGTGSDCGISYDGTDMVFNSSKVGSGTLKFNSANNWTANGTNTVTISNLAPSGVGTATINKWLTIKDNAGTIYYIPAWT